MKSIQVDNSIKKSDLIFLDIVNVLNIIFIALTIGCFVVISSIYLKERNFGAIDKSMLILFIFSVFLSVFTFNKFKRTRVKRAYAISLLFTKYTSLEVILTGSDIKYIYADDSGKVDLKNLCVDEVSKYINIEKPILVFHQTGFIEVKMPYVHILQEEPESIEPLSEDLIRFGMKETLDILNQAVKEMHQDNTSDKSEEEIADEALDHIIQTAKDINQSSNLSEINLEDYRFDEDEIEREMEEDIRNA